MLTNRHWLVWSLTSVVALGVWGMLSKVALRHLDWPEVALVYYAISCGVLALVAVMSRTTFAGAVRARYVVLFSALTGVVGLLCFYFALDLEDATIVVPLIAGVYPILTSALSVAFLGERLTRTAVAGVAFAIAAIVLISLG